MQARITDEIFKALGLDPAHWLRHAFGWVFGLPTRKFSRLFARADRATALEGLPGGCRSLVRDLALNLQISGIEHLDGAGPLLIVANHPGAYDSACLGAGVTRCDLRMLVYETGFYHALPAIDPWLIHTTHDPARRMLALRQAVAHLQSGGALLTFATGKIEPDPALGNGEDIGFADWSPAIEIMLRKVPETRLVLGIISDVLLPRFANHFAVRIRKDPIGQRRLAEYYQVIWHPLFPGSLQVQPKISFSPPMTLAGLQAGGSGERVMPEIIASARDLQESHLIRRVFQRPAFLRKSGM